MIFLTEWIWKRGNNVKFTIVCLSVRPLYGNHASLELVLEKCAKICTTGEAFWVYFVCTFARARELPAHVLGWDYEKLHAGISLIIQLRVIIFFISKRWSEITSEGPLASSHAKVFLFNPQLFPVNRIPLVTSRCEPPPKERVGIFSEGCEILE